MEKIAGAHTLKILDRKDVQINRPVATTIYFNACQKELGVRVRYLNALIVAYLFCLVLLTRARTCVCVCCLPEMAKEERGDVFSGVGLRLMTFKGIYATAYDDASQPAKLIPLAPVVRRRGIVL